MSNHSTTFASAICVTLLSGSPACHADTSRAVSVGKLELLNQAERLEYLSVWEAMGAVAGRGGVIPLEAAGPSALRFLELRLRMAGKNAENSPYLFEVLAGARRRASLPRALGAPAADAASSASDAAARVIQHFVIAKITEPERRGEGDAGTSVPGGSTYSYVDVLYSDANGTPLADLGMTEEFGGGTDVRASTQADLTGARADAYIADSNMLVSYIDANGEEQFAYSYVTDTRLADDTLTFDVVVDKPADARFNDQLINVCLNRTWTQDCDYDLTGVTWAVQLPLKGSLTLTSSNHALNVRAISSCRTTPGGCDLDGDGALTPEDGYIKMLLSQSGGGCDAERSLGMQEFWMATEVSNGNKTLSWDLAGATFGAPCRMVQERAVLLAKIRFPLVQLVPLEFKTSAVTITTPSDGGDVTLCCPITITNSCFAAGTLIEMADGTLAPVESIARGDLVSASAGLAARSLTVTDTASGYELEPMVRIQDEAGRSLLVTETHPVATLDRGMVVAKRLVRGDVVATRAGPRKLVDVRRERYDGRVYNLKIGSVAEKAGLGPDDTAVYANGFLAGDGQVQSRYERLELAKAEERDVAQRLPKRWQRDYESHLTRMPARRP